jgi:hypothetical protein
MCCKKLNATILVFNKRPAKLIRMFYARMEKRLRWFKFGTLIHRTLLMFFEETLRKRENFRMNDFFDFHFGFGTFMDF